MVCHGLETCALARRFVTKCSRRLHCPAQRIVSYTPCGSPMLANTGYLRVVAYGHRAANVVCAESHQHRLPSFGQNGNVVQFPNVPLHPEPVNKFAGSQVDDAQIALWFVGIGS